MGEIADLMLEGVLCQYCGEYLGDGDGFPQSCSCCGGDDDESDFEASHLFATKPIVESPKVWGCTGCKTMFRKKRHAVSHCKGAKHGEPVDTSARKLS